MSLARAALALALALLPAVAACQTDAPAPAPAALPPAPAVTAAPIVNGQAEAGWPAAGALTYRWGDQYAGSFCSGTLIAPDWVLTAGHCVAGAAEGPHSAITADQASFLVGPDARAAAGGQPVDGTLTPVRAFVPHPDYNPGTNANDIALVHLAAPVADVTPYAFSTTDLAALLATHRAAEVPLEVFTVGYGATEGLTSSGSGVKRSTTVVINAVEPNAYISAFAGTGTCFGDSGGPGFVTLDGVPAVVGVTSAGTSCPPGDPECDTCKTSTICTRVDVYAAWIQATIAAGPPACDVAPGLCRCPEACQADLSCDDSVCRVATCAETFSCTVGCDGDVDCAAACLVAAAPSAVAPAEALISCDAEQCGTLEPGSDARRACYRDRCRLIYNGCTGYGPATTGDEDCAHVYDCLGTCEGHDCVIGCQEAGTEEAQLTVNALAACLRNECRDAATDEAYQRCAHDKCQAQIDACYPVISGDKSCDYITDCVSSCSAGHPSCPRDCKNAGTLDAQAAYTALKTCTDASCAGLAPLERIACVQTQCAAEDLVCLPDTVIGAGCALAGGDCPAGTACVEGAAGTLCGLSGGAASGEACDADAAVRDCGDGLVCHHPPTTAAGLCGAPCTDADVDGSCVEADCDDTDGTAYPGATEVCDDGVDNDCSGVADDGCDPPVVEPGPTNGKPSDGGCAGGGAGGAAGLLAGLALVAVTLGRRRRALR